MCSDPYTGDAVKWGVQCAVIWGEQDGLELEGGLTEVDIAEVIWTPYSIA